MSTLVHECGGLDRVKDAGAQALENVVKEPQNPNSNLYTKVRGGTTRCSHRTCRYARVQGSITNMRFQRGRKEAWKNVKSHFAQWFPQSQCKSHYQTTGTLNPCKVKYGMSVVRCDRCQPQPGKQSQDGGKHE